MLLVALAAGAFAFMKYNEVKSLGAKAVEPASDEPIPFTVKKGSSPSKVVRDLKAKGLIEDAQLFRLYLQRIAKKANTIQAGEYVLNKSMSGDELIAALGKGRAKEISFTIPEGLRKNEIAEIIARSGLVTKRELLLAMNNKALANAFGVPKKGADGQDKIPGGIEGYLYPDTYQFPKGVSAEAILKKMRKRLDEVIDDKMRARMKEMGWSLHKVLTLASIVEKETGQAYERPLIAALFLNRMRMKPPMKLQTDPTVIYGIKNYDGNIRRRDLTTPHPYNTYTIKGLPPGPIASPGKNAINAVLFPGKTKALYFVSKNDGTHIFSETLAQHNAAVQKWQVEFFRNKRR